MRHPPEPDKQKVSLVTAARACRYECENNPLIDTMAAIAAQSGYRRSTASVSMNRRSGQTVVQVGDRIPHPFGSPAQRGDIGPRLQHLPRHRRQKLSR